MQHPDSRTADFTVQVKSKNLTFLPTHDGKDAAKLTLTAVSLDQYGTTLASRAEAITLKSSTGDPILLPDGPLPGNGMGVLFHRGKNGNSPGSQRPLRGTGAANRAEIKFTGRCYRFLVCAARRLFGACR